MRSRLMCHHGFTSEDWVNGYVQCCGARLAHRVGMPLRDHD
jgi:hypothetical protein